MASIHTLALVFALVFSLQAFGKVKAFPTAEGFGQNSIGGRGGRVIHVTNLNDTGPGSLRDALENQTGPRIVVFDVSGTINIWDFIRITGEAGSYVTIAGQTSPGGIQLKGNGIIAYQAHDVIMRYMRVRPGTHDPIPDDTNGFISWGELGNPTYNIIVDHCSFEWAEDQNGPDTYHYVHDITYQWNITAQGMWIPEASNGNHSLGQLLSAADDMTISVHHSLYANNQARSPAVGMAEVFDFRNNVIYNWSGDNGTSIGGSAGGYNQTVFANLVNNHYIRGPNSGPTHIFLENLGPVRVDGSPATDGGTRIYVEGNWGPHCPNGCADDWDNGYPNYDYWAMGVDVHRFPLTDQSQGRSFTPFNAPFVNTDPTYLVKDKVLAKVGATKPYRDTLDTSIINDVVNGTGSVYAANASVQWPNLASGAPNAPSDRDRDGMPDAWENSHGLNPDNANDGAAVSANGYTNVENYLNELAGDGESASLPPSPAPAPAPSPEPSPSLAPPPTGLKFTCNGTGDQVTLGWDSISEASSYYLRIDNLTNNTSSCASGWYCDSTDLMINNYVPTSYQASIIAGKDYSWWVHSINAVGYSAPVYGRFNCSATPSPISPSPDTTAPTVTITSPLDKSVVPRRTTVTVAATALDDDAVQRVEFFVKDMKTPLCIDGAAPYECAFNVGARRKRYKIKAVAYDAGGNFSATSVIRVTSK